MKTAYLTSAIFALLLLCTVNSKPSVDQDSDAYALDDADSNIQNDNEENYNDYGETEDRDDNGEDETVTITTKPQEFIRNVHDSVELPCEAKGSNYVLFWHNSSESMLFQSNIRAAAPKNMNQTPEGTLVINSILPEDEGTYKCTATLSKKNFATVTHVLKLNKPPKIETLRAEKDLTTLQSGETLTLTCVASGFPQPKISWHRTKANGEGERLAMEGDTLTIRDIKHRNAGTYQCFADNKIGKPDYKSIDIKVEYQPVVKIEKIAVSSDHNLDTELNCIVHAVPRATVVWKKDGQNVHHTEHTELSTKDHNHVLIIKGLQESDFGVYTCSAVSSVGTTDVNIKLVKTPAVLRFIKPQAEAKDIVLTWEVQSKSKISQHELQYRKKGDEIWEEAQPEVTNPEGDVYMVKYTLKNLKPGTYQTRVRSANKHGWSDYSEIMPFEGVYAKHGHHKHGQKNMKEKHITPTLEGAKQDVTNPEDEIPAEHQESESHTDKDIQTGASKPKEGDASRGTSSMSLIISIALVIFLHNAQ